jgi:flagellar biosynthesis regulator FlbT
MPLKIRVKPEGKIFAGGAVLKNVGKRPAELLILSDSPVLREEYMMNIDRRNDSDASNLYFLLQVIYLFKGKGEPLDQLVVATLRNFGALYPAYTDSVDQIIRHLEAGEPFKALRLGHKLLAEQQGANPSESRPSAAAESLVPSAELATIVS